MPASLKFGAGEIEKALRSFESVARKVPPRVTKNALLKGAQPILEAARTNLGQVTDEKTGNLRESLQDDEGKVFRKQKRNRGGVVIIGPAWPKGNHGHLIEFGHVIAQGKGGFVAGRPFLRPAWDANKNRAFSIVAKELQSGADSVEAAAGKAAK